MAQQNQENQNNSVAVRSSSDPLALDVNQIQKDKIVANIDQILLRASKNILNNFEYKYGFLDPASSPLVAYVEELAKNTLGENYLKVKIYVTKDYPGSNAFALPDGSIVISTELIKLGKYKEALQAVLKHEAEHVVDQHSKKAFLLGLEYSNNIEDQISKVFRNIGLSRIQEYSADFAWMVRDCDASGINPYGAIALFEALAAYEENQSPDLAHGMTSDRILNTRSLFYFFPFKYLSAELEEIPQQLMNGIVPDIFKVRVESPQIYIKDSAQVKDIQNARLDKIMELQAKDLILVLKDILEQSDEVSKQRNSTVIDKILERVTEDYFNDEQWQEEDPILLGLWLYLELGANTSCVWFDKNYNLKHLNHKDTASKSLIYYVNLIQEDVKNRSAELPILFTHPILQEIFKDTPANDPSNLIKNAIGVQLQQLGLLETFDPVKASKLLNSIQSIANAAESFSEECCVLPLSRDKLINDLAEHIFTFTFKNKEISVALHEYLQSSLRLNKLESLTSGRRVDIPETDLIMLQKILKQVIGSMPSDIRLEQGLVLDAKMKLMSLLGNSDSPSKAINYMQFILTDKSPKSMKLNTPRGLIEYRLTSFFAEILQEKIFSEFRPYEKQGLLVTFSAAIGIETSNIFDDSYCDLETKERVLLRLKYKNKFSCSEELIDSILLSQDQWLKQELSILDVTDFFRSSGQFSNPNVHLELDDRYRIKILSAFLYQNNSTIDQLVQQLNLLEENGIDARKIIESKPGEFSYVVAHFFDDLKIPKDTKDFDSYLELARFIESSLKRSTFVAFINSEKNKQSTLEERTTSVLSDFGDGIEGATEFRRITENEICTQADFNLIKSLTRGNLDKFLSEPSQMAGLATIASNFAPRHLRRNLDTARSLIGKGSHNILRYICMDNVLAIGDVRHANIELNLYSPMSVIQEAIVIEESMLSLPKLAKSLMLRRILAGQYGLISKPNLRSEFLTHLFEEAVDTKSETGLRSVFNDLITIAPKIKTWEPLYFALQGLLEPHILQASAEVITWSELAEEKYIFGDKIIDEAIKLEINGERSLSLLKGILSSKKDSPHWRQAPLFAELVNRSVYEFLLLNNASEVAKPYKQIDALDFVIDACQSAGSLGVRFLQILPQFVEIPEAYREKFNKVFDAVEGQSRVAAIYSLEENWDGFWQDVESVEPGRVGGGSIYSVFKLKMKENALHPEFSGKTLVVKVRNPNLEFHLDQTYSTLKEAITAMIEIDPKYKVAKLVLEDVYTWIKSEVEYKNYLEKDRVFAEKIKAYNSLQETCVFVVPKSYRVPGTVADDDPNLILIEEYLESNRLTENFQELEDKGYEMKSMVSQMIKNYFFQLANGMASSDLSLGNYILPKLEEQHSKKQIAIIDRLFFLELNEDLSQLLKPFISALDILAKDPKKFVDQLVGKIQNQVSEDIQQKAVSSLRQLRESLQTGNLSFEQTKQMILNISKLIPAVSDLVDYMLDLKNITMSNSEDFVNGIFMIAGKESNPDELKILSEQWSGAKSKLFSTGDLSEVKRVLDNIKNSLNLNLAEDQLFSTILNLAGMLSDSDESQLKSLFKLVKNKTITVTEKPFALKEWQKTKVELKNGNLTAVQDFFHSLRNRGFVFNIELTLIFKNLAVLNQMAKTAGFEKGFLQGLGYE